MILYKNKADGDLVVVKPVKILLENLVEEEDYHVIYTEDYTVGTDTIKTLAIKLGRVDDDYRFTTDIDNAVISPERATDLVVRAQWDKDSADDTWKIMNVEPWTRIEAGSPKPADFDVHWRDRYYTTNQSGTENDIKFEIYKDRAGSTYDTTIPYYFNNDLGTVYWTQSGGTFGCGLSYTKDMNTVVFTTSCIVKSTFAGYDYDYDPYRWEPGIRGLVTDRANSLITGTVFGAHDFAWGVDESTLLNGAFETKTRVVISDFDYDGDSYYGLCIITYDVGGLINGVKFWGAQKSWWSGTDNSTNYSADPEGTAQNRTKGKGLNSQGVGLGALAAPGTGNNRASLGTVLLDTNGNVKYLGGIHSFIFDIDGYGNFIGNLWGYSQADAQVEAGSLLNEKTYKLDDYSSALLNVISLPFTYSQVTDETTGGVGWVGSRGSARNITVGGQDSRVSIGTKLLKGRAMEKSCGKVEITFDEDNAWENYASTQGEVYIPYIGTFSIDMGLLANKVIELIYRTDVVTGDCIATLQTTDSEDNIMIIGQYSGSMAGSCYFYGESGARRRQIDYQTATAGTITGGISQISTGIASGNPITALAQGTLGVYNTMRGLNQAQMNYHTMHTTSSMIKGESTVLLNTLTQPYIKYITPKKVSGDHQPICGIPSGAVGTVGEFEGTKATGFQSYSAVDLKGISKASEAEKAEIMSLLQEGVFINVST